MKPFDLERAKAGEPIVTSDGTPQRFIGVRSDSSIVTELDDGALGLYTPHHLRMAEPERPQWQQDLIAAAKAGKVVEFKYAQVSGWGESDVNKRLDKYNFGDAVAEDYRIRPKKITRYLWAVKDADGDWALLPNFMTSEELIHAYFAHETKRLDWSATEFQE